MSTGAHVDPAVGPAVVAVVTGAASGIGRAAALNLVGAGYTVIGVDRDAAGLEETRALAGEAAGALVPHQADVSQDEACAGVMAVAERTGRLGVIVNCAGVMPPDDHVERLSPEVWDQTFAVNVRPIYLLARHGLRLLRPAGGVIVNVASVHAYASGTSTTAYAATKGAIVALTQQLALDLAVDGVRVVAVAPGSVDTPMSARSAQRSGVDSVADLGFPTSERATGRIGRPAEVAEAIGWLASTKASFVNGTTLRVDGALLSAIPTHAEPPAGGPDHDLARQEHR